MATVDGIYRLLLKNGFSGGVWYTGPGSIPGRSADCNHGGKQEGAGSTPAAANLAFKKGTTVWRD